MSTVTIAEQEVPTPRPRETARPVRSPSLQAGDHLTRAEFERRYSARPDLKNAELIEGVVYMPSPVRFKSHGQPDRHIQTWLGSYEAATPGVSGAGNCTIHLDNDNAPQPDSFLRIDPARGGQTTDSADDFVEGAPELIVEVASSSVSYDLHSKKNAYRRNGVREYLVVLPEEQQVLWWALREGQYEPLVADAAGVVRSETFPGLRLDTTALLAGNLAQLLTRLQEGLASAEHAAFVSRLAAAGPR